MKYKQKKGAIFTIATIVISALILSTYFSLQEIPADSNLVNARTRIRQSNFYISQIREATENMARNSAITVLQKTINTMKNRNAFQTPSNFDKNVHTCLINGSDATWCDPKNALQPKLNDLAKFGVDNIGFDYMNVSIKNKSQIALFQSNPWSITVQVNLTILANDKYAEWNISNMVINADFSIMNWSDPTYFIPGNDANSQSIINAYGNESKRIFTRNVSEWKTPSGFNNYMDEGMYFNTTKGVSYLDRLRNDVKTSNCCGIASFMTNKIVNESQSNTAHVKEEYGNMDVIFFKQIRNGSSIWNLKLLNFWNDEPTNYRLSETRSLVQINNVTGEHINGTIIPDGITNDVGMPPSVSPKIYLVTPVVSLPN